jgi:hypothetical protein
MKNIITAIIVFTFAFAAFAQENEVLESDSNGTASTLASKSPSETLAEKAFEAHGGKKYKDMKTLIVRGDVDVTASVINQAIPATFITIYSGDKYRLEIDNPFQPFKQVFDGEVTQTSVQRGFTFPPINRLGLPLLQRLGEEGFVVSDLRKKKKKKTGFRLTSPEGYYTDFYLDKKTNRVKGYDSSYIVNNREVTTTVEISNYEEKEGIMIPRKYAQRFDLGQMTVYAEFSAKEILVNTEVDDDVFRL